MKEKNKQQRRNEERRKRGERKREKDRKFITFNRETNPLAFCNLYLESINI